MSNLPTIAELRKAGFKVSVRHHRRYKFVPPEDVCLMKHEAVPAATQRWEQCSTGGFCEIHVTPPGQSKPVIGRSDCSVKDHYNKRVARNIALGRIAAQIKLKKVDLDAPVPPMPVYDVDQLETAKA